MSNKVREFRLAAGMSQTTLARRLKIANQNLSAIELGRMAAWPRIRRRLSKIFGVPQEQIFPDDN